MKLQRLIIQCIPKDRMDGAMVNLAVRGALTFLMFLATSAVCLPALAGKRVALVIGNSNYTIGPLANPINDAKAMAQSFESLGFDKVLLRTDLGVECICKALGEIAREAVGADIAVIFYAGHGTEAAGRNYLIPVDATLERASDLDLQAISLTTAMDQLGGARLLRLVILDACRNNIFPMSGSTRSVNRGLARVEPEYNTLVVYAAKEGTTADDGTGRQHSPFTQALLKHLATPGIDVTFVFRRVRDDVMAATSPPQQPHVYGTLGGQEIYLNASGAHLTAPSPLPPQQITPVPVVSEAERGWAEIKDSTNTGLLEAFIQRFGGTFYADLAQSRLEDLKSQQAMLAPKPTPSAPARRALLVDKMAKSRWGTNSGANCRYAAKVYALSISGDTITWRNGAGETDTEAIESSSETTLETRTVASYRPSGGKGVARGTSWSYADGGSRFIDVSKNGKFAFRLGRCS